MLRGFLILIVVVVILTWIMSAPHLHGTEFRNWIESAGAFIHSVAGGH